MMKTSTQLVIVTSPCPNCGITFGVPEDFDRERRADGRTFYCPNGHSLTFGKSEAEKLRMQLNYANTALTAARDQARSAERRRAAAAGQVTKIRNRVVGGVCPCCTRTFENLARHMGTKHPEWTA
jgi:hypothetical protein